MAHFAELNSANEVLRGTVVENKINLSGASAGG